MDATEVPRVSHRDCASMAWATCEDQDENEVTGNGYQTRESVPIVMVNTQAPTFDTQSNDGLHVRLHPHLAFSDVEEDFDDEDDGIISILGGNSPRSVQSTTPRSQLLQLGVDRQGADYGDVFGETDTIRSTATSSNSDGFQPNARTVLGETLTIEGGLDGGLTGVLNRLALENLALDETLTRSVQRVLQFETVLTGQRLADDEIQALPKVRYDKLEQHHCSICLEAYQQGTLLTALRCNHFFHVDCLARWFQCSIQCPLCRSQCVD